jgi:hypothetical protein
MLCAEVVQAIYQAIRDEGLEPYASSAHALEWDLFLASIEVLPAPHLLAQNELSASLSPRAESVHLGDRRAEAAASARHAALLDAVRAGAQSRDFGICRDLCSRSAVELALNTGDARADAQAVDQVCEAAQLLREDPKGYGLIATKDDLPLGFEIKQSHVLVEIPRGLAQRFPHGDVDLARLHPDEKVCYHIRSEALASQLTTLFDQLAAHAGEQMASEDATAEWMSRLARKYEAQASARGPRL